MGEKMKHLRKLALIPGNRVCKHCNMWTRSEARCFNCGTVLVVEIQISLEFALELSPEAERGDETGG